MPEVKDGLNEPTNMMRTTIFITETLNLNLDLLALTTGISKGEHVRRAITEYLERQGLDPHKKPKIKISY